MKLHEEVFGSKEPRSIGEIINTEPQIIKTTQDLIDYLIAFYDDSTDSTDN